MNSSTDAKAMFTERNASFEARQDSKYDVIESQFLMMSPGIMIQQ